MSAFCAAALSRRRDRRASCSAIRRPPPADNSSARILLTDRLTSERINAMKRLLLALLATSAVTVLPHIPARADAPIIFGISAEPYAPFSYKSPAGVWEGFEPDLARALCEQMKAQCKISEIAWDGIIPALLAHKIDVIFTSMSITAEREKTVAFTIPYYDTPVDVTAP